MLAPSIDWWIYTKCGVVVEILSEPIITPANIIILKLAMNLREELLPNA
jgi:hypothetical protein